MIVPNSFMANVLTRIRAPVTPNAVRNLQTWERYEGGNAEWNPLNTTDRHPASTDYNSAHVQNYPTAAEGELATAQTLMNGRYSAILVKLRTGAPLAAWNEPSVLEQIATWGSVGFANYIRTLANPTPKPPPIFIEKDDIMKVVDAANGSYLLGGNFLVAISNGDTRQAWINSGCEVVDITKDPLMYARLIERFPQPATPAQ